MPSITPNIFRRLTQRDATDKRKVEQAARIERERKHNAAMDRRYFGFSVDGLRNLFRDAISSRQQAHWPSQKRRGKARSGPLPPLRNPWRYRVYRWRKRHQKWQMIAGSDDQSAMSMVAHRAQMRYGQQNIRTEGF